MAGPGLLARLTWQAVTVWFHSTILSGCRITSWYTSSAGQGRKAWGRAGTGLGGANCAQAHSPSLWVERKLPEGPSAPTSSPRWGRQLQDTPEHPIPSLTFRMNVLP